MTLQAFNLASLQVQAQVPQIDATLTPLGKILMCR